MNKFVLCLLLLTIHCSAQAAQTQPDSATAGIQRLIKSLPPDSTLRHMLEHGAKGDGIHHPWMDVMQKDGVKLAEFTFEFVWSKKGRERVDWRLVSQRYFKDYEGAEPLTNQQLDRIEATGLAKDLEEEALSQAKRGIWFEHPSGKRGTGFRQVDLADNEWLPVSLGRFFGQYDPNTTPLMHAALLGDVARINRLLSQGSDVNAVTPTGDTALSYAAASKNAEAVSCLLDAGARLKVDGKSASNALVTAVVTDHPKAVSLLLDAGADPNSRNFAGETVLSISNRQHYTDITAMLRRAGAQQ